jgi:hypothetical protein
MASEKEPPENNPPFPVSDHRFDQKNEMFKRAVWDEEMQPYSQRFYREAVYQEKIGYRKIDYALRNASWNLEWSAALGNSQSNYGLYSWEGFPEKIRHFVEKDGPVEGTPEDMANTVKKAAKLLGADLVGRKILEQLKNAKYRISLVLCPFLFLLRSPP